MDLYELTDNYLVLQDTTEEQYQQSLTEIEDEISTKIESIGKVLKNISAEKDAYKTEILRMQNNIKTIDSKTDYLKEYIKSNMEFAGIDKVGDIVKVTLRKSPPSCTLTDINKVPDEFKISKTNIPSSEISEELKQYVTEEVISKKEIVNLWKDGIDIEGTEIVNNKHVRIS